MDKKLLKKWRKLKNEYVELMSEIEIHQFSISNIEKFEKCKEYVKKLHFIAERLSNFYGYESVF